ncbi:T9SS type B sorting domain-containing protein [Flavobacteriaceae bacterium 14752]|uniref:T9SS type B sorting domain-containing protein n=1 Tax=Mesohalobacter salilacus TaxID=2491711 RepID=UPI000F641B10|nr:gliding motility-associated C-terminal domain-containing protein [Flavobacteriaceae bacterium 14752]
MKLRFLISILVFTFGYTSWSQINFCPGSTGEAIFEEDFGQGITNGPPLGPEVTTYTFVNQAPQDGQYTISSNLMQLGSFHDIPDNTSGDANGKALIVNADFDADLFFQIPINGLCENNPYEFSAFLVNVYDSSSGACPGTGIPVNVRFQIWDETDTTLLAEGSTGDIPGTTSPSWEQFAVTFETLPGQTSVILKMLNNGDGGCGNDLAIDDIAFKSCGDLTEIFDEDNAGSLEICENESIAGLTLTAVPDFSVYDTHFYQWQQSDDNVNWTDIPGETSETLVLNSINTTQFFRVKVAEDLINVNNNLCNSISNVFEINVQDFIPAVSLGDVEVCEGESAVLEVQNNPDISVDWFDSPIGGNLLLEDSFNFEPENEGTFYAESTTIEGSCVNPTRTPVSFTLNNTPENDTVNIEICPSDTIILDAEIPNVTYLWSTGETTAQIEVDEAGSFSVERTTENGCSSTKVFEVSFLEAAVVSEIKSVGRDIVIELENQGDFSFSLDGQNFQTSPVFENVSGGLYNISIQSNDCGVQVIEFPHLVIPQFFTPNGDGFNDFFRIPADRFFDEFSIYVFDRYGKLIASGARAPFVWDGTFNGKALPSQDYWYRLEIDGQTYTGNITLKR